MMRKKLTPMEQELVRLRKQESDLLHRKLKQSSPLLDQLLEDKVPAKLQSTLETAFAKAFSLIFEKGTGVIELTCRKEKRKETWQRNQKAVQENPAALRAFSKTAEESGNFNLLFSGVSGVGLGILGIGLPDIALFTATILKSIYEIALSYGFEYQTEAEKRFILLLIRGAVSQGTEFWRVDMELNRFLDTGSFPAETSLPAVMRQTADSLSNELLYMKFLQGIPLIGAVGGAYDAVYLKKIVTYAELKYRRRFYQNANNTNYSGGVQYEQ